MISKSEATRIVKEGLPEGEIQKVIDYEDVYIFQVFRKDELEEQIGSHYSVHKETGLLRDYSIIHDGDIDEITELFMKA